MSSGECMMFMVRLHDLYHYHSFKLIVVYTVTHDVVSQGECSVCKC